MSEAELVGQLKRILPGSTRQVHADRVKTEQQRKKDWPDDLIGRIIGNEKTAPFSIALIVVLLTFLFPIGLVVARPRMAERPIVLQGILAILATTLGYLFRYKISGRG